MPRTSARQRNRRRRASTTAPKDAAPTARAARATGTSLRELRALLAIARDVVVDAAPVAARGRERTLEVTRKGVGDFVTDVDLLVEEKISRDLARRCSGHNFLGEETGLVDRGSRWTWVVDPIDGTTNYLRGLPHFAVALACLGEDLHPAVAAVFVFPERRLYAAARGLGAFGNSRRLRCGPGTFDTSSVLGVQWLRGTRELPYLDPLLSSGARVRNFGCSVSQICDVVEGRLDANLQEQGRLWDIAAPGLIALEAGARFTDWRGLPIFPVPDLDGARHYPSLAAGPRAHARILRALRGALDVSSS